MKWGAGNHASAGKRRPPAALVAFLVLAAGCVSYAPAPTVNEAQGAESISVAWLSCGNVARFTRDCSELWGPELEVSLPGNGLEPLVAGTEDGRIFMLFGSSPTKMQSPEELANDSNAAYVAFRTELAAAGITIERAQPLLTLGLLSGYVVYTNGDAYAVLQTLAQGEDSP